MARKIDKTIKLCVICGDKAKGINFNVLTCMSCKAFFRRNALRKKDMKCPFNDTCQIDKITRKFCSKCRLKKCFESGMKKEWILSDEEKRLIKEKIMRNKLHKQQQQIESCSGRINDHNNKHHKKLNNSNSVEQKSLTTHRKRGRKSINQSLNSNNSHESNNIDDNLPIADATNQSLINQEILISNDLNDYHSEMTSDKSFFNQFVTSNSNNGSIDQYNFNSNNNNFDLNNLNNTVNTSYIDPFESILELTTATTTTSTSTSMVSLSSTASTISSPLNQSIMTVTTTAKTAPSMTAAAKTTATIDLCRRMFTEPHAYNLDTILTMDETDIDFDSGIGFIDINQRFQIAHHHLNNNNSNINISNNHYYYQRCPTLSDTYLNNYHNNNNISLMNQLQPQQHSKLNSNSISINNNNCTNLNDDSDNYYYDSGVKTMIDFDEFNNNLNNNNNNNYSSNNNNLNTNNFINIKAENDNFNETNINNTNNINKNVDSYFQTTSSPIPLASSPANIIENMNFDLTTIDTFDNTDSTNKYQSKSSSVEINDKLIKESESQSSLFMNENNSLRPNLCDMENIDIDIDINNMNKIESIENNIINNNNTDTDTQLVTDDEKLIINSVNIEDFSQYLLHDNDPPLTYQQRRQQQQQQHQESSSIHSNRFNMDQSNKAPFNESLNAPSQIDNQMMIIAANHSNNNLINDGSISLVDDGYDSISHHKLITPSSNSMNISKYFSYIDDGESIPITRPISSVNDDELMLEELLSIQELSNACLLLKNPYKRIQYSTLFCKNPKYPSHLSHGCGISEFYIHRLIRMSKRLRSFATLIRSEQIDLLRSNIIDMLIIRSILFYDPDRDAYCFVDDKCKVSIMVDTEIIKPCCIKYDYERHMNFKAKFRHEWKNDNIIFDLLTAIVLFTPRSNQDQNRKIRQEYSRYTCLLYRYLQIKYGPNSDDANESFKILMSLIDELRLLSEDISKLFSIYRVIHSYPLFMDLYGFNNDGNNSNNSSNDTMIVAKTNHCMPPPSSATSASASRIKNYIDFNMNNDYHHQQQRQIQQQNYSSTHSINNNSQNNECCEFVF